MAMEKTVLIDGKEVRFRASAAVPRLYRLRYRRDILTDVRKLQAAMERKEKAQEVTGDDADAGAAELDHISLQLFEDIAYIMAKHADPSIANTAEEWLEDFETFSVYIVLPEILELWQLNEETHVEVKKNTKKFLIAKSRRR